MKYSNIAIDRPRLVGMATILVVAMALLAATLMPVQRTPAISIAVVIIAVPYPGADPTEAEEQITRKIEDALQKLSDVDFISSSSMRGSSVTQVLFLDGVDADAARGEVQDLVDQIMRELPLGREVQPVVTDIDFESSPIMLVNMTGPIGFDERSLKRIAEEVQDELEIIEGVSNTQLFGGRQREFHVDIDVDLAAEYGLSLADFQSAIRVHHAPLPGGTTNTGSRDQQVRSETRLRTTDDIGTIVLREQEGHTLRIRDVATVSDTHRRLINIAQLDGRSCATIIVNKEADINLLATSEEVRERVSELSQEYSNIKFSTSRETSQEISLMFRVLGSSFLFGAMLVLLILTWSMGFRISILVLLAIPLSSAVGLIFLYFFNIPISNMVIFSFILVLGMVVDGAIIVAENIHRHIERGEDSVTAAKLGIEEVGTPVIMADLTTVAAYLPMLLVPGMMGDFMGVMPKVVSAALFGSILVDHFLIPTLAARWYRRRTTKNQNNAPLSNEVEAASTEATEKPKPEPPESINQTRIRPKLGPISRGYLGMLRWALANRWAVFLCTVLALVWANIMIGHVGFVFFPPSDRGQFEIKYELPLGSSIEQTVVAAELLTRPLELLRENDELVNYVTAIGSSEGLSNRLETDPTAGPEFGTIMVQLTSPLDRERHQRLIIEELRERLDILLPEMPGLKYTVEEVQEGPPGGYDVAVRLTGEELEILGDVSKQIVTEIHSLEGVNDIGTDYRDESPMIRLQDDPGILGVYHLSPQQIAATVQTAINGDTSILLSIGDEDVPLRLQASQEYQQSASDISRLMITSPDGRRIPIGELAKIERTVGLYSVNHRDGNRAVVAHCKVEGETKPDDIFGVLRSTILPALNFQPLEREEQGFFAKTARWISVQVFHKTPEAKATIFVGAQGTKVEGIRATFTGENEERDENFGYLVNSMSIAVILIFAILVFQFNSFRQSFVILLTVPLSFVGVVFGLWVCNFPFSLAAFIGLVSLTGIVVNDAIVMVDFVNQARKRGAALREAILEAGVNRLRPVLLTTATTIGGLLPLLLNLTGGTEFWQPLTAAVIFGLGFSTMLTLLVIPVSYSVAYNREFRR